VALGSHRQEALRAVAVGDLAEDRRGRLEQRRAGTAAALYQGRLVAALEELRADVEFLQRVPRVDRPHQLAVALDDHLLITVAAAPVAQANQVLDARVLRAGDEHARAAVLTARPPRLNPVRLAGGSRAR